MLDWFDKHSIIAICIIIALFIGPLIGEFVHYKLEDEHQVYVEWTVYRDGYAHDYKDTINIVGDNFRVLSYWRTTKHHRNDHRIVQIVDGNAWHSYIGKQSVCIYTGTNDVDVRTIKIIK